MDSHYQAVHFDDNAAVEFSTQKIFFAVLSSFVIAFLIHLTYRLQHTRASRDNREVCTDQEDSGIASSRHEPEDSFQPGDPVSVEYGLDSVLFDVWQATLLPMLSVADIFQLLGASRRLREMLLNEYTFKRICQHRYQLSVDLGVEYMSTAKHLFIAHSVASLDVFDDITNRCKICRRPQKPDPNSAIEHSVRKRLIVQLSCLALLPPKTFGQAPELSIFGSLMPHLGDLYLSADEASSFLPNLSSDNIGNDLNPLGIALSFEVRLYRLADVVKWWFQRFESIEKYQKAILNRIEQELEEAVSHMPCTNFYRRLVEFSECFHGASKRNARLLPSLAKDMQIFTIPRFPITGWAYNPYYVWENMYDLKGPPIDDLCASDMWINATIKMAPYHSVLLFLINGLIRTSQVEDYFIAIMEYEEYWESLPHSRRPSRAALHIGLGDYLLSLEPESNLRKELNNVDLYNAMLQFGHELVPNESYSLLQRFSTLLL
ncbi:uncharacterized protein LOC135825340 isoform X1 [Sycon ciliatum]|uniref:uncharacterized protein LOC135825339 isoform X1 n=2 Tax=Sycon ciliatum TaxID=27933 RepID=UPI0031F62184